MESLLRTTSQATGTSQVSSPGILLCGDLNSTAELPGGAHSVLVADGSWVDLWKGNGSFLGSATHPSCIYSCCPRRCLVPYVGLRIDHILALRRNNNTNSNNGLAGKVKCCSIKVLSDDPEDINASDHCALCAAIYIADDDNNDKNNSSTNSNNNYNHNSNSNNDNNNDADVCDSGSGSEDGRSSEASDDGCDMM
ncbi:unnamed protein product, partial [Polarella glacialis]